MVQRWPNSGVLRSPFAAGAGGSVPFTFGSSSAASRGADDGGVAATSGGFRQQDVEVQRFSRSHFTFDPFVFITLSREGVLDSGSVRTRKLPRAAASACATARVRASSRVFF